MNARCAVDESPTFGAVKAALTPASEVVTDV